MWYGFEIGVGIVFGMLAAVIAVKLVRKTWQGSVALAASIYSALQRFWHWLGRVLPAYPADGWR